MNRVALVAFSHEGKDKETTIRCGQEDDESTIRAHMATHWPGSSTSKVRFFRSDFTLTLWMLVMAPFGRGA